MEKRISMLPVTVGLPHCAATQSQQGLAHSPSRDVTADDVILHLFIQRGPKSSVQLPKTGFPALALKGRPIWYQRARTWPEPPRPYNRQHIRRKF